MVSKEKLVTKPILQGLRSFKARHAKNISKGPDECSLLGKQGKVVMAKRGLYANINARKKAGTSRSKKKSTISPKAYANMKRGFKKK